MGRDTRDRSETPRLHERETEGERQAANGEIESGMEKQRARERARVLRRCAVTDDPYFQMYCVAPVLLSALVCSASSEIPVATACRRGGSCVVLRGAGKKKGETKRRKRR